MNEFNEKIWILNEKRENILDAQGEQISLRKFVEMEAESNPDFFRWLFGENFDQDYDFSLSKIQKHEFEKWKETL